MGEIANTNKEAITALIDTIKDGHSEVRRHVAEALGTQQVYSPTFTQTQTKEKDKEEHEDNDVRGKIVDALCTMLSQDTDVQVRHQACLSLLKLADKRATPTLFKAFKNDDNRYVVAYALDALIRLEKDVPVDIQRELIRILALHRWCPFTSAKSTF